MPKIDMRQMMWRYSCGVETVKEYIRVGFLPPPIMTGGEPYWDEDALRAFEEERRERTLRGKRGEE